MRIAVVGATAVASLVFASAVAALMPSAGFAQRAIAPSTNGSGLITSVATVGDHQQLMVIDPENRTMAVYHIDSAKGEIELKSVRKIEFDLKMLEFNGTRPLPNDIRAMLEQR
jgi:hypothetical protein